MRLTLPSTARFALPKTDTTSFAFAFPRRKPLVDGSLIFDVGAYQAQFRIFRILRDTGAFEAPRETFKDEDAKEA